MDHVTELVAILKVFFPWNKSRLECLAQVIIALFSARTVNTVTLSHHFLGKAQSESYCKRILRLLSWLPSIWGYRRKLIYAVIHMLNLHDKKLDLAMDRTEWKFGSIHINLLVIGVRFHDVSVPIYFKSMNKKGCSFTKQRVSVIQSILKVIPVENIKSFTADREFVGTEWFKFIQKTGVPFFIRIKKDAQIKRPGCRFPIPVEILANGLKKKKKKIFDKPFEISGVQLYIAIARNTQGDLTIIASNVSSQSVFKHYMQRWCIETLFKYLKTHGFNFEDTRIKSSRKLEAWIFILTLAVTWSLLISKTLQKKRPLKKATHGRKRESFFKRGFSELRRCITGVTIHVEVLIGHCYLMLPKHFLKGGLKGIEKSGKTKNTFKMHFQRC